MIFDTVTKYSPQIHNQNIRKISFKKRLFLSVEKEFKNNFIFAPFSNLYEGMIDDTGKQDSSYLRTPRAGWEMGPPDLSEVLRTGPSSGTMPAVVFGCFTMTSSGDIRL